MNKVQFSQSNNYYTTIKGIKVYVDYTNQRLKILDFGFISASTIDDILSFSRQKDLGKIITNCKIMYLDLFISKGFVLEGVINGFFRREDAYCVACFIDSHRQLSLNNQTKDAILNHCLNDTKKFFLQKKYSYTIRQAKANDIPEMIKLFSAVFISYPSPVFNKDYLNIMMAEHVLYQVAEMDGKIVAIASADMDKNNLNAEITDCVTYPEYRGRGILTNMIYSLESALKESGFFTAYSLARAINPGINKAFSRMEYKYGGRLQNNCHICGDFEDMNVWGKELY